MPQLWVSFKDTDIKTSQMPGKNRAEKLSAKLKALAENDERCRSKLLAWLHDKDPNASFDDEGVLSANYAAIAKLQNKRPDYIEGTNEPVKTAIQFGTTIAALLSPNHSV